GARSAEVRLATWEQFDFESGTWTKPDHATKQGREHHIPLSPPALRLLGNMPRTDARVFPGLNDLRRHWVKLRGGADIENARVHDLRPSYASMLASSGVSLPIIGALLGHTVPTTTARYTHLFREPLREATSRVGAIVTVAAEGSKAEVLPFK